MRNGICYLAALALMSISPAWSSESNMEGIKAYRMGDYAKAEQLYRQALTEEQDRGQLAAIYRNLSLLYSAQGKDGSEFTKKADELNPAAKPSYVKDDLKSVLLNNSSTPSTVNSESQSNRASQFLNTQAESTTSTQPENNPSSRNDFHRTPGFVGTGVYGSSSTSSFSLNGGFRLGQPREGEGRILPVGSNGGLRGDSGSGYPGNYGYGPGYGGTFYSSQTPDSKFESSTNTPIVLPVPNGRPVIINAPGPNVYSQQTAPDGSTTTLRVGTY